jgi:ABC-type sugar transport system substrate-binding protein
MNMKKFIVFFTVAGVIMALLAGCGKKAENSSGNAKMKIGFSESSFDGAWRVAEVDDLTQAAEKYGYDLIITNANSDIEKQIADVEDLLAQKVDLIVIVPVDANAVAPAFNAIKAAGIPCIDLDTEYLDGTWKTDYITVIRSDQYQQGQGCAEWLIADAADKTVRVLEITGNPGQSDAQKRSAGFTETLAGHANISIFSVQNGQWSRSIAQEVVQNVIQSTAGNFDYIYTHSDEMALGAMMGIKQAGFKPGVDIRIVTVDGQFEALDYVKTDEISAITTCTPKGGDMLFSAIDKYFAGETLENTYLVHQSVITKDNVGELYYVEGF